MPPHNIVVIGDIILDHNIYCKFNKIANEFGSATVTIKKYAKTGQIYKGHKIEIIPKPS